MEEAPMMKRDATPTTDLFSTYQAMFDHFNATLWAGQLPQAILNLSRYRGAYGVFMPSRWAPVAEAKPQRQGGRCRRPLSANGWTNGQPEERRHEISLNPDHSNRLPRDIAGTLVHEMAHHWQQVFGKPGRGAYHNQQWATEMKRVGLQPVSFDRPGTEVGCKVSHTIIPGGAFDKAFAELPEKAMPWAIGAPRAFVVTGPDGSVVAPPSPVTKRPGGAARNKRTYVCGCGNKVWGKPGLSLRCGDCVEDFVEQ
jgi:hypothetical protein